MLAKRLADALDRLGEANKRIEELEAEVERLTKSLQQIRTEANQLQSHGVSSVDDIWYTAHQVLKGSEDTSND